MEPDADWNRMYRGEPVLKYKVVQGLRSITIGYETNRYTSFLIEKSDTSIVIAILNEFSNAIYGNDAATHQRWEFLSLTPESKMSIVRQSWLFEWRSKPFIGSNLVY